MKFRCNCGNIIHDTTDFLSYKANFLANQDEEDFDDGMELLLNESLSKEECLNKMWSLYTHYASRSMYQCSKCGRIFLEDIEGNLHCFVPEEHDNKSLLVSVEGREWEGVLYAEWKDVKPEWCEQRGYISIATNESYNGQVFDDWDTLFKCYYELFDELKQKKLIRSARLRKNGKCIHSWVKKKEERIDEFIKENNISIFAVGDVNNNLFKIYYGDTKCSSMDLFEQLIEYGSVSTLIESCEGQLLPRIWSQGKTKGILCKLSDNKIVVLFMDYELEPKENYMRAKELDLKVKTLFE